MEKKTKDKIRKMINSFVVNLTGAILVLMGLSATLLSILLIVEPKPEWLMVWGIGVLILIHTDKE